MIFLSAHGVVGSVADGVVVFDVAVEFADVSAGSLVICVDGGVVVFVLMLGVFVV